MGFEIKRLSDREDDTMAKTAEVRVYRTVDGKFVGEGDPDGAFLAYAVGGEVAPGDSDAYDEFLDKHRGKSKADKAYTDDSTRDELRRRQAGDVTARTPLDTQPVLIHDRLATELADEARVIANVGAEKAVEVAESVDSDRKLSRHRLYRTDDGDLVHEGDPKAARLAYAVGDPIADDDLDEVDDLGDPPPPDEGDGGESDSSTASNTPPATKRTPAKATKATATR